MHKKIDQLSEDYRTLVLQQLYPIFDQLIQKELQEYETLAKQIQDLYQKGGHNLERLLEIKQQILQYTEAIWNSYEPEDFQVFANTFLEALEQKIDELPGQMKAEQLPERFSIQQEDGTLLKGGKLIKRFFWQITQLPNRIMRKPTTYWQHKVPLQRVAHGTLVNLLASKITPMLHLYYVTLMQGYKSLHAWERAQSSETTDEAIALHIEELKKEIAKIKHQLKQEIIDLGERCIETFQQEAARLGTIEKLFHPYHTDKLKKRLTSSNERWYKQDQGWIITFDTFLESWRSELGIRILMLQAQKELVIFKSGQAKNVNEYIGEELNSIDAFINESLKLLEGEEKELIKEIKKRIYQTQKLLDKELIPSLLDKLGNKNMINGIFRLEASTQKAAEALNEKRKIPKEATDYLSPLEPDQVTTISPYDIITFEIAPQLGEELNGVKSELVGQLQENILSAQDLDHMISYSLSSAVEEYEHNQNIAAAKDIATESLQRSAARVEDVRTSLLQCMERANERISTAVEKFVEALQDLTHTENVREIRMRIMKARAVQSTEEYRDQMRNKVLTLYQKLTAQVKSLIGKIGALARRVREFLSLSEQEEVDIEVSNFLLDSEKIIDSLPLIYRNLYRISPVTDQELYVGRSRELTDLKEAYSYWQEGKKGAIAIVGEKWSGLTSFVNHVEKEGIFKYKCNRFVAHSDDFGKEAIFSFLSDVLGEKISSTSDWSEVAEKINLSSKKVIIIENVQGLHLRKVGGLEHLTGLSELIQLTSHTILWVLTCNLYSWQYFQKTILLDESFRFEIKLLPPTPEEIEELIQKRNRISGYKLFFIPAEDDAHSKRFKKLPEEKQQEELKSRFFKKLIEFSSSNISLALMFWLLSTEEVTKDRIKIKEFKKPNFNFLSTLSMDKVFTLHQLILHDGLNSAQMASLSRLPKQACHMLLSSMHEDGVLLMKKDIYLVNPLIYRSVISLLTAKNLL